MHDELRCMCVHSLVICFVPRNGAVTCCHLIENFEGRSKLRPVLSQDTAAFRPIEVVSKCKHTHTHTHTHKQTSREKWRERERETELLFEEIFSRPPYISKAHTEHVCIHTYIRPKAGNVALAVVDPLTA